MEVMRPTAKGPRALADPSDSGENAGAALRAKAIGTLSVSAVERVNGGARPVAIKKGARGVSQGRRVNFILACGVRVTTIEKPNDGLAERVGLASVYDSLKPTVLIGD